MTLPIPRRSRRRAKPDVAPLEQPSAAPADSRSPRDGDPQTGHALPADGMPPPRQEEMPVRPTRLSFAAQTVESDAFVSRFDSAEIDERTIVEHGRFAAKAIRIRVSGSGNRLVIADGVHLDKLSINIVGNRNTISIGPDARVKGGLNMQGDAGLIAIGAGCTFNSSNASILINESGTKLVLGAGCLLADVVLRTSDAHPIFDRRTGQRLNRPADILIGDHVWLASDVLVLKGTTIGEGCVVAARAVVTGRFPANCLLGGIPARILRRGIAWRKDTAIDSIEPEAF
jgi:acetyltransferase-like isoleucine patch superfamily enzyme